MEPEVGKTHCSHVSRTDADLAAVGRSRDAAALEILLRPLVQPAYRLAYTTLRNRDDAEDGVQEATLPSVANYRRVVETASRLSFGAGSFDVPNPKRAFGP
jgi:hypothetical protein